MPKQHDKTTGRASPTSSKKTTRKPGRPPKGPALGTDRNLKQGLLNATIQLIADRGFDGFALRDIAEKVGVHTALVGYYFKSKEQLERAALDHHIMETRDALKAMIPSKELSPEEALSHLFTGLRQHVESTEINHRLNRWIIARGGAYSRDWNERVYNYILGFIELQYARLFPKMPKEEHLVRSMIFLFLARNAFHFNPFSSLTQLSRAEAIELYERIVRSSLIPALSK